ncbi:hypothetical protein [Dactylosporangium sp. NPDC051484]|uniref:hypothetical protein n=1 Tax=Dactylosporangium sp. NPDC051484 TaxID=3154942 RepID=UPI00344D8E52
MSQRANGEDDSGRRNARLYYLLVGGAGIVLLPFTVALHEQLWPQLLSLLLLVGAGVAGLVKSMRGSKPRSFVVQPGEFVAPPSYFGLANNAAAMPAIVGILLSVAYSDDDWGVYTWMLFAVTVAFMYFAVYGLVMLIRGTGRLILRPDGLTVVDALGTYDVPWEAIMTGPLPTVFGVGRLGILWPELVRSHGPLRRRNPQRIQLQLQRSAVHREFLHDSVNHYLNHPQERPAIGTREGLDGLLGALHVRRA